MNQLADFDRLSAVGAWINTLPVYMFSGALTAALLLLAYEEDDLDVVDDAVRMVLNYQASLEAPMHHERFIEMVKRVMAETPPEVLVRFLAREATH